MATSKIDDNLIRILLLVTLLFILYCFILFPLGFLQPLRLNINDILFNMLRYAKQPQGPVQETVIVEIDEESLLKIGKKWPWERAFFAEIIERIASYKPRIISIDITFFGESPNPEEDQRLAEVINRVGNVILPSYITEQGDHITPHTPFLSSAYGCGFVNKITDPDDRIRKARLIYQRSSPPKTFFAFEIISAGAYLGIPPDKISYKDGEIIIDNNHIVPVDKKGALYIDYSPIQNISSIPLQSITEENTELEDLLKDKIVMLGHTSKTLHDIHQTPQGKMPGVFINTFTLDTILKKMFISDTPIPITLIIVFVTILLTSFFTYRLSVPKGILFLISEIILVMFTSLLITTFNLRTDYFSVLFLMLLSYSVANSYKYGLLIYSNNRLRRMVITDTITGLATPRYFQFKLQLDMAKAGEAKAGISVAVFNIPEFQELLRKYRREELEFILRQFSLILKQNSRKKVDLISRWKEDRFAAILLKTDIKDAITYCQKIISKIEENEFLLPDTAIHLTVYAGISNYPATKIQSPLALIACAEAASNRARTTSEKVIVFNPQKDKIHVEILQKESTAKEEDYLSVDIAEREKELYKTLGELKESQTEIQKAHFETILSLIKALEEKDPYTAGHSERVSNYAVGIAKQLGLEESEITLIRESALLHDVGKFGLPDLILHKKEPLTEDELNQIKKHPVMGARILEKSKFFENHIPLILHHHEHYDGKGYPHGLSGKFIPRGAHIVGIADATDAMTTGRGYNHPLRIEETIQELKKSSGTHFDPDYIKSAIDFLEGTR